MYKRISVIVCFALLLMTGCSGTQDVTKQKEEKVDKTSPNRKVNENKNESTQAVNIDFEKIKAYISPNTLDDLTKMPPGLLSKDVPYEKETSQVWGNFDMSDYQGAMVEKLRALTAETDDVDTIYKGLLYYLGSNSYSQSIERLRDYKGGLYEPYLPEPSDIKTNRKNPSSPGKALILLDASSSMLLNVDGKQKMKIAKTAVGRFASTIGQENEISLYVYGHKGTQADKDKILSCSSIEEVYPLQHYDANRFSDAVEGIQAKGWTPLAGAIKTVREKTASMDGSITLYIVSDGAETCGGDPIKEAKRFAEENNHRKVNIIGFDVDQKSESQLKKVAKAGNGDYISANTTNELDNSITKKWVPSIFDVMEKHNSLLNNWGKTWTNLTERSALADRILYASYNEKSRLSQAIGLMQSNNLLSNEKLEQLSKLVEDHQQNIVEEMKKLEQAKNEEEKQELARIQKKVDDWGKRMDKLRGE
ncbi:vWA domain-containing protein [Heyndrickxia sp. NPDC080065]|uniref:vWA domain-containing protein n=1 Tax=Heyndrickxia sp. NPDC080065 TaxID=3390568 RepID=UPI003CFD5155